MDGQAARGRRRRAELFRIIVTFPRGRRPADAIRMANDSHYGLAAYVRSHDLGRALRAAHAIEAGWVQVNQGLGQSPGHSYGGVKKKRSAPARCPPNASERAT